MPKHCLFYVTVKCENYILTCLLLTQIPWHNIDIPLGCISWSMKLGAFIQQTYIEIHSVPDAMLDAGDRTAVDTALEVFTKASEATSDLPKSIVGENN